MTTAADYSEQKLVEEPAIALFAALGWETVYAFHEAFSPDGAKGLGREHMGEVVLRPRLKDALRRLNPGLPSEAIAQAVEELARDRSAMSPGHANREVYRLIREGVKVSLRYDAGDGEDEEAVVTVRVVDWDDPTNNDFLLVSQFWVMGELYKRRADLVGFVNGLPLLFVELKAAHKKLETAFTGNLTDYKTAVPQLFWHNALIVLSNGSATRVGSMTAGWEHFAEWKKINSEGEEGVVSLDTAIRGTCEPGRFLDLVENFTLFDESRGAPVKVVAKYHQYFGVNNAIAAVDRLEENQGRLGVFWHTQGSGKSLSMVFFSQKVLRKRPGNWTFVVVTDRQELDDQIYKNFVSVGAVTEARAQAGSAAELRRLLREDHRYVFTLIQKFRTANGEPHPVLSDRSDVIVMTDEAHRSQYDIFAANMRAALPNAAFIGFTGTPLIAGEEKTREVFGDYVSVYDFKQSVLDGATVPLYYENRIPELQLTNDQLNEDMEGILDDAELDDAQQAKLEREFGREYHLITRDDRLETIAQDIVRHFTGRGHQGKAMVVCVDKATAVRMYDKVCVHWSARLAELEGRLATAPELERPGIAEQIGAMRRVDMAVIVSQSQNEEAVLNQKGLTIKPHRERMVKEDLDKKFKDQEDPLSLVFVCAMWMTGFDAPSVSTIYLDKPMRNHTLMQTIARANRVAQDKVNGLIVDYIGVFRSLQRALAIYGAATGERAGASDGDGTTPVESKQQLIERLKTVVSDAQSFCAERGVNLEAIREAQGFERIKLLDDAVEALEEPQTKERFLLLAGDAARLYKAILPDPAAVEYAPACVLLAVLAEKIRSNEDEADISDVMLQVEDLLDRSVASEAYVIRERRDKFGQAKLVDLSQVDFDALRKRFAEGHQRTQAERLKALLQRKLGQLVRLNKSRMDYLARFQAMIDAYNAGSVNVEHFFEQLVTLTQELTEEEQRAVAEQLSEEELAIFDLLTRPDPTLTEAEAKDVKKVARDLLDTLKREKLVLEWRRKQAARAGVRVCIEETLDRLPETYSKEIYDRKCDAVYQHVFESYYGEGRSIYVA